MHLVNGTGNSPSLGQPTPGVVKQDKSSGGSVDTTKTRSDPQRVRMSSGERPIGAAKGKQSDTEALCQPPPPSPPPPSRGGGHGSRAWVRLNVGSTHPAVGDAGWGVSPTGWQQPEAPRDQESRCQCPCTAVTSVAHLFVGTSAFCCHKRPEHDAGPQRTVDPVSEARCCLPALWVTAWTRPQQWPQSCVPEGVNDCSPLFPFLWFFPPLQSRPPPPPCTRSTRQLTPPVHQNQHASTMQSWGASACVNFSQLLPRHQLSIPQVSSANPC